MSSLTIFYIYDNITQKATNDIARVISHNIHLQELNLESHYLQASGAMQIVRSLQKNLASIGGNHLHSVGFIYIAKGLRNISTLLFNANNITQNAADDIAAAISHNIGLQELNLGNNSLQTSGTIEVARSLQISSLTLTIIV